MRRIKWMDECWIQKGKRGSGKISHADLHIVEWRYSNIWEKKKRAKATEAADSFPRCQYKASFHWTYIWHYFWRMVISPFNLFSSKSGCVHPWVWFNWIGTKSKKQKKLWCRPNPLVCDLLQAVPCKFKIGCLVLFRCPFLLLIIKHFQLPIPMKSEHCVQPE